MNKTRRPEQAVHQAVIAHLEARGTQGMFYFHPANGGKRTPREAAIFKTLGVRAGVPDIIILWRGRTFGLELKASRRGLTESQRTTHALMRDAGATVGTANGIDEALHVLSEWGLLRGNVNIGGADG